MSLTAERAGTFAHAGHALAYGSFGQGERVVVLAHGLFFDRRMQLPLARALAGRGHRVVCLDLLGHGASDAPTHPSAYGVPRFAEQVLALLDHLGVKRAVVGGTSLGANASLEVAVRAPERVRGLLIEMPVLDRALLGCVATFTPLMLGLTVGRVPARAVARVARAVPGGLIGRGGDLLLETVRRDPAVTAAILGGLFLARSAPNPHQRAAIAAPALVLGHRRDPVHSFADAEALALALPAGRLLEARSIVELRGQPERLTPEIESFVDACWDSSSPSGRQPPVAPR